MFDLLKAGRKMASAIVITLALCLGLVLGMAACGGGGDDQGTEIMQDALAVVENDINTLQADFATGQKTGADVKAVLVDVAPHWQAVVDACDAVGADKAQAEELWSDIVQVADGLADDAGLVELAALLDPLMAIQGYMGELRELVGYPEGVTTTVGATTTSEEVTTTTLPEGIDPELVGTWHSDYMEESLTYGADGTLLVTWDDAYGSGSETFSYVVEDGTTIDGAGNRVPYSIDGDTLTIEDSEEGTQTYIRVIE